MSNSELLTAISDILDQKLDEKVTPQFEKLDERLTGVEGRLTNVEGKLSDVDDRLTNVEGKLSDVDDRLTNVEGIISDVEDKISDMGENLTNLTGRVKNIELTIENELVPRISHIEQCYIDTFERYQDGIGKLEEMQRDIDVIKITVTSHSEEINKFTGPYLVK